MSEIPLRRYVEARRARTPALSPDGRTLAYVSDVTGYFEAWLSPGPGREPVPLTEFRERVGRLLWARDGRHLVLDTDLGGDECWAIRSVRPDGRDHRTLSDDPCAMHVLAAASPDGARIACAVNARDPAVFDPALIDLGTGSLRILLAAEGSVFPEDFSPDGLHLLASRVHGSFRQDLLLIPTGPGEVREITTSGEAVRHLGPRFEGTGRSLLLLADRDRDHLALCRLRLESRVTETVHAAEGRDVEAFAAAPDGSVALVVVNDRGWSRLFLLEPASGRVTALPHPEGVIAEPVVSADGSRGAFTLSGPSSPSEVYRVDLAARTTERATFSPREELPENLVRPEEVRYRSFDGVEIPGWLWRPGGFSGPRPALVKLHGGPEAQARPVFDPLAQYLLSRGVAVYEPNVRGSTGYGRAFAALDDRRLRFDAVKDLAEAARFLRADAGVDADRIALMGGSYGGFLVLAGLAFFPELFAAGVSVCGIADFRTFLDRTGPYRRAWRIEEYGDPEEDGEFLDSISPVRAADRIRAPLLVIQGANDPRVPAPVAKGIVQAVRAAGGHAEYLEFADEGHGIVKLENRLAADQATVRFVTEHAF